MRQDRIINVFFHDRLVGTLAMTNERKAAFEYADEWLENGFSISPFSLPLEKKVYVPVKDYFNGLWGVFADSLPDAWGQLLLDRMLKEKGYNITIVNERFIKPVDTDMLDRLSESHRLIVTMEENVLSGGFGEAACQYYDDTCNDIDVLNIALPDDYVEHGNVDILRRESGVDRDSIIAKVLNRWANVLNKDKKNE